ncbi:MAG: bifunctional 3-deoxy-7-phosphoheptulonate synthase/chorismate mutase type II [Bacteroidales bacterium]|nr:bifunctional 3-deoxy-7-phosphoheptulonate synthase/chorismate mutase type II [Bacteroidales bacterium]
MSESFDIRRWFKNPEELLVISGPCSVETREQLMTTAKGLSEIDKVKVLRGGIWKPRTRPDAFEGIGEEGLRWMKEAKEKYGFLTMTEVAVPDHVNLALKNGIDILWLGARTVANPFSVQELADCLKGCDIPVFVKNPIAPDLKLWLGAFERLGSAGLTCLGGIHRGFSSYDDTRYRNAPVWEIPVELKRLRPDIQIITDVSHICGCRELLQEVAQKALDFGTLGFMIESHCDPEKALTDANQQITPESLKKALNHLVIKKRVVDEDEFVLQNLRKEIDIIDDELLNLLAKRMNVSEKIGEFKKEHKVAVLQMDRWSKVLEDHINKGVNLGLDEESVKDIFEIIHKDSIKKQLY